MEQRRPAKWRAGMGRRGGCLLRDEGGETALLAVSFAGVNRAAASRAVEGGIGGRQRRRHSLRIAGGDGLADISDGGASDGAACAIPVAPLEGLVPPLNSGFVVCHGLRRLRWAGARCKTLDMMRKQTATGDERRPAPPYTDADPGQRLRCCTGTKYDVGAGGSSAPDECGPAWNNHLISRIPQDPLKRRPAHRRNMRVHAFDNTD